MADSRPIGVFDSGIGGLTVLREIVRQLPNESLMYLADSREAPYGTKSLAALAERCERVAAFLLGREAKAIVVACNTASVAALPHLRGRFSVPFVGIVPAVKPAAALTRTGTVGVLATAATTTSQPLAQLIDTYANGVRVVTQECPELVTLVEQGQLGGPEVEGVVRLEVAPLLDAGADVVVLGCTHLPFLLSAIADVCGPEVRLIDPSDAVARQLGRVLVEHDLASAGPGEWTRYLTTGDPTEFKRRLTELMGDVGRPVEGVDL